MSQLEELRRIIIGDSSEQLAELKSRLDDIDQRTRDVAEVLSPAIDAELQDGGQRLVTSLQKPVSIGLKQAIRSEPRDYAEILYPVMAPSIRRAIAQAISSMLRTINRTIESATSVRGIRTRIQSWRTGVPYAELLLRQSIIYRVEHLYLIDRATGMLIDEVAAEGARSLDSDAISAMFSAIQSFVQDSFSRDESERLTDLRVGDHNVWVAHGPKLMLACVIWGDAPESLKTELYDALDLIRSDYAIPIAEFSGDSRLFEGVNHLMEPLLQLRQKDDYDSTGGPSALFMLLLVCAIAGYFVVQWFLKSTQIATVEHYLKKTAGVAATDIYWQGEKIVVEGLKDPDATLPLGTLHAYGIDAEELLLQMVPFRSLEAEMELRRFEKEFRLPDGVTLMISDDRVQLQGDAPIDWLDEHDVRLRQLFADDRLSISSLVASSESVLSRIQDTLSTEDLEGILVAKVAGQGHDRVGVSGRVSEQGLVQLQDLFAGNQWVSLNASQDSGSLPNDSQ